MQQSPDRVINFILGSRSGIGKTLFARFLFYALVEAGTKAIGIDADQRNPEFVRYHADTNRFGMAPLNVLDAKNHPKLFSILTGDLSPDAQQRFPKLAQLCPPDAIVVDLPSYSVRQFCSMLSHSNLIASCREAGYQITITTILNRGIIPIQALNQVMDTCQEQVNYLVVKNSFWDKEVEKPSQDVPKSTYVPFERWMGSQQRQRFLAYGGIETNLLNLSIGTFTALEDEGTSFFDLDSLEIGDECVIRSFLRRGLPQLKVAASILGLPIEESVLNA